MRRSLALSCRRSYVAIIMGARSLVRRTTPLSSGAPGSGKGTISNYLVRDYDFKHVSSGHMLRSHMDRGSPLGKEAQRYVSAGALVPDDIIIDLVAAELADSSADRVLIDGFPRTLGQAERLDASVAVDAAFNLDIPTEIIVQRLSNRWIHAPSGRV